MSEEITAPTRLAVAITAKDSMRTIERTLASVAGLADRILVVDSGSTDGTIETCRRAGAEVVHRAWEGNVAAKQFALDRCANAAWILVLDSDESLEPELADSVRTAVERDDRAFAGHEINRKLHFAGAWLHHAFQPEWRLRLVRGGAGRAHGQAPHDEITVPGRVGRLRGDCRHDSFADLEDMLRRQLGYAKSAAAGGARGGSLWHILVSPGAAFLKQAVLRQGVRDGWRGIVLAGGAAASTLMKHLFIMQRRREPRG